MERISCSVCNTGINIVNVKFIRYLIFLSLLSSLPNINLEEFFEKYIIKRMPVAFTDENVSKSIGNPVKTLWSNSYLQSRSGTQYVGFR